MIPGFRASNGGVAGGERAEEPELAGAANAGCWAAPAVDLRRGHQRRSSTHGPNIIGYQQTMNE